MAASDARPVPIKNQAYRVTFPILDADGDLVTGAASLDSEVSKDGGTFADCTNEATEIATASGMYYLDLTSTEMNADTVAIIVKTSTSGAKTTPIVLYPQEAGDIKVDVESISGDTVAADNLEAMLDGTGGTTLTTNITGSITGSLTGSVGSVTGAVGSVTGNVGGNVVGSVGSVTATVTVGAMTAAALADFFDTDSLTTYAGAVAGSVVKEIADNAGGSALTEAGIADAVWDELLSGHTTAGSAGKALSDVLVDTAEIGSAGAGLTAIPWNAAWDAEVQSECTDALNAYDPPTNTEMVAAFTEIKGATWSSTTDTLEAIRDRGDAAWVTATGFSTLDAAGVRSAVGLASANLDTQLTAIVGDTNELQTDWADGGRLDVILDARASQASVDTIGGIVDQILADTGTDGVVLSSSTRDSIATSLLDLAAGVETNRTLRQALRLILSACVGKLSGAATTTVAIRDTNDTKDRITATVDADGNRSTVTLDGT